MNLRSVIFVLFFFNTFLIESTAYAADPEWLNLLHYKSNLISSGFKSQVDDPNFFLAADGKTDPDNELAANVTAASPGPNTVEPIGGEPYPCRFPARYDYLKRAGLVAPPAASPRCTELDEWTATLGATGATLIFTASYLNNPASMFGHSFLRLDTFVAGEKNPLLSYAANYAALTKDTNGILFAAKGVAGGYRGSFTTAPYYEMLKTYSDLENRDIWEYDLGFTQAETDQFVRHLWELGHTYFDYYFFDENCSYHLLGALEAIKPKLDMTSRFFFHAIPTETVRAILEEQGFVGRRYRPSKYTMISARAEELSVKNRKLADEIARNGVENYSEQLRPVEPQEEAEVLDLAFPYLEYLNSKGQIGNEEAKENGREILLARSKLGNIPRREPDFSKMKPPEDGHKPGRVLTEFGAANGELETRLTVRPAYHELMDAEAGYARGAEIRFMELQGSYVEGEGPEFDRFTPVRVFSLTPWTTLFHPISWSASTDVARIKYGEGEDEQTETSGSFSGGVSFNLSQATLMYALQGARLGIDSDQSMIRQATTRVGTFSDLSEKVRIQGEGLAAFNLFSSEPTDLIFNLRLRYTTCKESALFLDATSGREFDNYRNEILAGIGVYF